MKKKNWIIRIAVPAVLIIVGIPLIFGLILILSDSAYYSSGSFSHSIELDQVLTITRAKDAGYSVKTVFDESRGVIPVEHIERLSSQVGDRYLVPYVYYYKNDYQLELMINIPSQNGKTSITYLRENADEVESLDDIQDDWVIDTGV